MKRGTYERTKKHRKKMSNVLKGRVFTEEWKYKIWITRWSKKKGKKQKSWGKHTQKTKNKISKSHKGFKHSEETKRKMSRVRIGIKLSESTKEKCL